MKSLNNYRLPRRILYIIFAIDVAGYIIKNFLGLFKKSSGINFKEQQFKKILLIRLDHAGDMVLLSPVYKLLREKYPFSKIDLLIGSWAKEIVEGNKYIDGIIEYNAHWFNRDKNKSVNIKETLGLLGKLRKENYDLAIEFRGDIRNILLFSFAGFRHFIGYSISGLGFLLDKELLFKKTVHQVDLNLALLEFLGVNISCPQLYIPYSDEDKTIVTELAGSLNTGKGNIEKTICIHPGVGRSSGQWPPAYFSRLSDLLVESGKFNVLLVSGHSEQDRNKISDILNNSNNSKKIKVIDKKINLRQLFGIISNCDFFIGLESGPAHIAAAAGVKGISIFSGIVRGDGFNPWSSQIKVIRKETSCSPCGKISCDNITCMTTLLPEEIYKCVLELI